MTAAPQRKGTRKGVVETEEPNVWGFVVRLHHRCGLTYAQERDTERRVLNFLEARGMQHDGTQTILIVHADQELGPVAQVTVLLGMLDDPDVRIVGITAMMHDAPTFRDVDGYAWLDVDCFDPLLHAARALYEANRLNAQAFLSALGGFKTSVGAADREAP